MADRLLTAADAAPVERAARRRLPWWGSVLLVFLASRVVTTVILLAFAAAQPANPFSGAQPSYDRLALYWDGVWYHWIATAGYPSTLPVDAAGHVTENAWAFMPAYAWMSAGLAAITRLPYAVAAITVSVLCSAGTALLLHRMLVPRLSSAAALWGVTLFCFAPLSPILQVGYAEPLQLLALAAALLLVMRRHYLWALPVIVLMGFTRPTALAFALFLALHLVQRWRSRASEPLDRAQLAGILAAAGLSLLAGLAWPAIAAVATGDPQAYTATELVWRASYVGRQEFIPFTPWFVGADFWFRFAFGTPSPLSIVLGAVVVLTAVALLALVLLSRAARRLGPEPRLWTLSYGLYLLAVFFPQSSTFRLLMPMFPVLPALQPRHPMAKAAVLGASVALQVGWTAIAWWVVYPDWSPP